MVRLDDYETLIGAMGALFYISKKMAREVPCCFEQWKTFAFERRASKLHEMLSTATMATAPDKADRRTPSQSGVNELENDLDGYFDRCEVEEYIQVHDDDLSCHVLPLSPTNYDSCHR